MEMGIKKIICSLWLLSIASIGVSQNTVKIETSYFQNDDYLSCNGDFEVGKLNQIASTNGEQKITVMGTITNKTAMTVGFNSVTQIQTSQGPFRQFNINNILFNGQSLVVAEMTSITTNQANDGSSSVLTNHIGVKITATWD